MPNKLTTEQFIEKAREVHGDKFDYSLTLAISNGFLHSKKQHLPLQKAFKDYIK